MKTAWNDLALFAAVARHGQLARAATETGASPATLSRRMTALEKSMGRRLFLHGAQGYAPTAEGRELLAKAERMEAAAAEISQWQAKVSGPTRVRISAGTWTSLLLARDLPKYWTASDNWVPEFLHRNGEMDIARREIDIGLRNKRPDQPWLAGRSVGDVHFAIYGQAGMDPETAPWIGASHDAAATRSASWVRKTHEAQIVTTVNDPKLGMHLAEAGVGCIVFPMMIGETRPRLTRLSDPIPELSHARWLVSHHETRFDPGIRAALDAIAGYLGDTK
ncbi:LysR family transcriptional regulator [Shimia ponticola]|uniref:LysR family transcriptional regulator n=1 Tax=Shimia ponticola TaxID=2582893 RepID=UPI0011BDC35D|nr:LysR family transcriptional regulator [Shimia ponticola]